MTAHSPLLLLILLVADDEDEHIVASMLLSVIDPAHEVVVGFDAGDVVDDEDGVGIAKIARDQAFKSLLPCSVPQLEPDGPFGEYDGFGDEVDANGWLGR